MLARYPLKPKQFKKAQTLASKNLDKVYGKIRKQFTKNVYHQDANEPSAAVGTGRATPLGGRQASAGGGPGLMGRAGPLGGTTYSQNSVLEGGRGGEISS
mmetsp:Transcript_38082/g.58111  ORF Transcript_38082/g.58111 Transcript_38082/m.58111 type:complete len:100 (+) Transcript_38082:313-612(+)